MRAKSAGRRRLVAAAPAVFGLLGALSLAGITPAIAQRPVAPEATEKAAEKTTPAAGALVPGFWDPQRRPEKPDLPSGAVIRFMTEIDYPPFNYAGPDGSPIGLSVDLARMLCEELQLACTVQMRRFDTLLDALAENRGDAVIASLAGTMEVRAKAEFSDPYYRSPARFVVRKENAAGEVTPESLAGERIGVVARTAHEAYLKTLFAGAEIRSFPTDLAARQALQKGEVRLLFGDAIQLSFWLNGSDSAACCAFRGGPFTESRYFGDGIGIAVRPGNDLLRRALNWALWQLWSKGRFTDLWLRYFPISPY